MNRRLLAATPLFVLASTLVLISLGTSRKTAVAQQGRALYREGQVLVVYKPGASPASRQQSNARLNAAESRRFADPSVRLLRLPPGITTESALQRLKSDPAVAHAQPNYIYRINVEPDDPQFADGALWAMKNTGQNGGTNDADIDAPEAWDLHTGSSEVVVAVIDTGVDYNHPDLAANIWTNPGEVAGNGIDDDSNGYIDDVHGWDTFANDSNPMDEHDHGTHCAGAIGASGNNGIGVVGVNWNVKIMAVKFLDANGSGDTAGAIAALDYVHTLKDSGVNVVATSNSWGGIPFDQALRNAIEASNARGILFVAAAGNGNFLGQAQNNDTTAHYPSNFDNANVIAVAATDRNDRKASFSNYGLNTVDLGAPGVDIWSTTRNNTYKSFSGTSMATPHVAGAVALLKAFDPSLFHLQLKNRVMATGDPINDLINRTVSGKRLNLDKMLRNVVTQLPPPPPAPTLGVAVRTEDSWGFPRTSFRFGQTVYVRITTSYSGAAVTNAAVNLEITTPSGRKYNGSGVTNFLGYIRFYYRSVSTDGAGIHVAKATATKSGFSVGSGQVTYNVTP